MSKIFEAFFVELDTEQCGPPPITAECRNDFKGDYFGPEIYKLNTVSERHKVVISLEKEKLRIVKSVRS